MIDHVIETENLTRSYGDLKAVDALSIGVRRGEVYGFLGPNGAGKTTTIRMLVGLIRPDSGVIRISGERFSSRRHDLLSRIGSIIETPAIWPNLTGRENLHAACHLRKISLKETDRVLDIVDLSKAANRKAGEYSLGMRQRLGIARALLGHPDLLILDEPTNGLDPSGIREIRQLIAAAPERFGTTILVSSHLLSEVEQMASRVGIMNGGRLLFDGTLAELKDTAPARLDIEVDRTHEALIELRKTYPDAVEMNGGIGLSGVDKTEAASINRRLIEAGFTVYGLRLRPASLEDIFIHLTGEAQP